MFQLAKGAFAAVGHDLTKIDRIGKLGEEDFPTARLRQLESDIIQEKNSVIRFESELKKCSFRSGECHLQCD